jgi:hypothetical protein
VYALAKQKLVYENYTTMIKNLGTVYLFLKNGDCVFQPGNWVHPGGKKSIQAGRRPELRS